MKKALLIMTSVFALVAGEVTFAQVAQVEEATVQALESSQTGRAALQKYLNLSGDAVNAKTVIEQISKYGAGQNVQNAIAAFAAKTAAGMNAEDAARAVFTVNGKLLEGNQLTANVNNRSTRVSNFLSSTTSVPAAGHVGQDQTTCSIADFYSGYGNAISSSESSDFKNNEEAGLRESGVRPVVVGDCNGGVTKYGAVAKRNLNKILAMVVSAHNYSRTMWKKAYKSVMGSSDETAAQAVYDFENVCHIIQPVGT